MTKFDKSQFTSGEVATYNGRFVARFKRGGRASFISFLCKNFTVEEYFAELDAGLTPLQVLQNRGYILPHIVRWLKQQNYPVTAAGYKKFITDQSTARM
jgi:hypothetical protein